MSEPVNYFEEEIAELLKISEKYGIEADTAEEYWEKLMEAREREYAGACARECACERASECARECASECSHESECSHKGDEKC